MATECSVATILLGHDMKTDCMKCKHKMFCMVNGSICYSKSMELTWAASERFTQSSYPKCSSELSKEYMDIDKRRNCTVAYSPTN